MFPIITAVLQAAAEGGRQGGEEEVRAMSPPPICAQLSFCCFLLCTDCRFYDIVLAITVEVEDPRLGKVLTLKQQ